MSNPSKEQLSKLNNLKEYLKEKKSLAVAFSYGVDSTFLLKVAKEVLGDKVIAITAISDLFPNKEMDEAKSFCEKEDIKHVTFKHNEFEIEGFSHNPQNRCYICKNKVFTEIINLAKKNDIYVIAEGSNVDDQSDYRPGLKAIKELGVISPLYECDLTKDDIRVISKYLGLPTWDKPSFACLASRFVYGEEITKEKLAMVDKAEQYLFGLGFKQLRVRIHGMMARIELLPKDMERIMSGNLYSQVAKELKSYGFTYVTLDLIGYRTGSMNETLN